MCFVVLISCDLWNFSTQKKKTFLWEDFVQLIIISSYMIYAFSCLGTLPFCILFHELEVDSQVNYVSIFSLRTYSVCTFIFHVNYVAQKSAAGPASLHFHGHFFLHSLAHKRKKSWLQVTSCQHLLRTLCKHILYRVTLWVTVFEK